MKNLISRKEKEIIEEAARNVLEERERYRQALDEAELQYNARMEQINQETQDAQYQCDIVQKTLDALRERREVLNEEAIQIRIKNKIYDQKRDYTDEEFNTLKGLKKINMIRHEMKKRSIDVLVKYDLDEDYL